MTCHVYVFIAKGMSNLTTFLIDGYSSKKE
jgi:hypothetical protein